MSEPGAPASPQGPDPDARPALQAELFRRVARLRVDAWTAEVTRELHRAGIRPVLLKGPVVARRLYADDPIERPYVDSDLLVAPQHTERARAVLTRLGFEVEEHPVLQQDEHHARIFLRESDHANVDLHTTFHGMQALSPERAWAAISRHLRTIEIGGVEIDAPDDTLFPLIVVLHLRAIDRERSKAWRDLERALAQISRADWERAAQLARELGIEAELAARLRRLPEGSALADALGIADAGSAYYELVGAVDRREAGDGVLALHRLLTQRSAGDALRYLVSKLAPPQEQLLRDHPQLAARGRGGMLAARVLRLWRIARELPRTIRAYRRAAAPQKSGHTRG
jgi:hypothetical protein